MIAAIDNYAIFAGVPELCELHGDNQQVSALKIGISLSVLSNVEIALTALQGVLEFKSFDQSPKIVFNLSALPNAIVELEIILEDGSLLRVDHVELIISSNGEHSCFVLAFVDSFTNTSRWEILLSRIDC
ncbi:hypothetical protein [Acinetobacter nosocomialis]|uniref:hypothetical protein n=1 Tax=Acinetobacter nosocomialis TaxID=106654 RepID=UPI001F486298|nr:hypothetical protein [Acinetobacter nosocomialis]MCE7534299.1 hypothetical protein [Acinetobacter nosocomialis]